MNTEPKTEAQKKAKREQYKSRIKGIFAGFVPSQMLAIFNSDSSNTSYI